jgi:glyoxylase-like metal-dependent hydrolase (beta-lactamase superfamily II)
MKFSLLTFCLFYSGLLLNAQNNFDTVKVRSEKLSNNIYMLKGAGGNIGVLTGNDGVLMIDDQFAPLGAKIKEAIASLDPGTIRFTINTHLHGDHSGSNEYFKQIGSTLVAHDLVRDRMMKEKVNKAPEPNTPPRPKDAWPVVTFANTLNIHLNDQDIELVHFDPAHTDGDIIVHFKQANIFHMGDLFVTYGYPYIDMTSGGNINGMISSLDKAMTMMDDNSIVIPGHGNASKKSDVKKFRDKLADIRDQVAAALKKGKKIEDINSLGITDKYDAEWGKGFIKGKDFVLIVAAGLNGK